LKKGGVKPREVCLRRQEGEKKKFSQKSLRGIYGYKAMNGGVLAKRNFGREGGNVGSSLKGKDE